MQTSLPENWKDIKLENKVIYYNIKENVFCFHPTFSLDNLQLFLDLYQFKINKQDLVNKLDNKLDFTDKNKSTLQMIQQTKSNNIQNNQSENSANSKHNFDTHPIKDINTVKLISNFWEQNRNDLQVVLRKVTSEKYSTNPNFEYSLDDSNKQKLKYICQIRIRAEFVLAKGESYVSKIKARENSIVNALKTLVPTCYAKNVKEEIEIFDDSIHDSLFTSNSIIDLDSSRGSLSCFKFTNSSLFSEIPQSSPKSHDFLAKKRKNENIINEIDDDDYVFGGCLKEDVYTELLIDDPLVVDKYISCSNFTPITILNTFKQNNPKVDVSEKSYVRNDGIKFDSLKNDNYIKIVIESRSLNIVVESSSDNKRFAREYCAQKFLKRLYNARFNKWAELVKYYEDKGYTRDKFNI